jgi:hypothetical protein
MPMVGCNETEGSGGSGGSAATGGAGGGGGDAGSGGTGGSAGSGGSGGSAGSAGSGGVGGIGGGVGCVYGAQEQDAITCINGEAPTTDAGTVYFNAENCADAANTVYDLTLASTATVGVVYLWVGGENAQCNLVANRNETMGICAEIAGNPRSVGSNFLVSNLILQELLDARAGATEIVSCETSGLRGTPYEIFAFRDEAPGGDDVGVEGYGVAQFKVGVTLPE